MREPKLSDLRSSNISLSVPSQHLAQSDAHRANANLTDHCLVPGILALICHARVRHLDRVVFDPLMGSVMRGFLSANQAAILIR